ncbi:YceI family protein [Formosa maritima]|uniref:YceI family protein n=1 Tax=Formosa maritima TaxID=2592046 RepID=A0A5D0GID7_9FLAO|nr:YceI family protein [Formosa maritima]TYA57312.1 YceI family protein [Formosa maritima]
MKKISFIFIFLFSFSIFSQERYLTKSGQLVFEASVPSFEEVKAENESTTAILNTNNGEIAALVLVKGFRFKNALMEEHFNENYAESDLYPKATFKGTIKNFTEINFMNSKTNNAVIEGTMTFHGQSNQVFSNDALITKEEDTIILKGSFNVQASDFKVNIPKIVSNKLSNDVLITYNLELIKK